MSALRERGHDQEGTTRKGAQRYRCRACESIEYALTATVFADQQLTISEMFHVIRGMEEHTTNEIFQELDRTDKTALDFIHDVRDALAEDLGFDLSDVCEAEEVYVVLARRDSKTRT